MKLCLYCGNEIKKHLSKKRKWCSPHCRNKAQKEKRDKILKELGYNSKISKSKRGALGELKVAADLMEKDYEVFRALDPHCSCDLAILKNKKLFRVEVRTSTYDATGKPYGHNKKIKADILALVLPDKIIYETFNLPFVLS